MNQVVPLEPQQSQPQRLPTIQAGGPVRAIVPQDFEGAWRIASAVCKAGMAPRGLEAPEKAMVAILHGLEIGLTPMNALQSIAVVNGRPTVWGDGAIGLVRGSGLCEFIKERIEGTGDARAAVCEAKRKGESEPIRRTFSVADAKKAGLWGKAGPWQQYPDRMLQVRARAFALRDGFADILKGLGIKEEIEDYHNAPMVAREEPPAPPLQRSEEAPPTPAEELVTTQSPDEPVEWTEPSTEQEAASPEQPPAPPPAISQTAVASDFPGDKPMKASDDGLDIPPYLRRTAEPMAEWLVSLSNALSGCESTEQLAEAQNKYQAPMKASASKSEWESSQKLVMEAFQRISGD